MTIIMHAPRQGAPYIEIRCQTQKGHAYLTRLDLMDAPYNWAAYALDFVRKCGWLCDWNIDCWYSPLPSWPNESVVTFRHKIGTRP